MTDRTYVDHLEGILEAAEEARAFTAGISYETFAEDEKQSSPLEVIGEATKRLPSELRDEYSAVSWSSMAGMRDKLIHDYEDVTTSLNAPALS